ncbi:hypothetical protein WS105_0651 [Weissella ceti]|uniref:hypothetical protein n=1 Tax=Weissella ceti TaxID=759620 RepID=UPI0004F8D742|nr:hypothetical protein [Weissella ceti]AIM64241.1 hypothetical protein WS105_0651 [Weissella ceti]
MATTLEGIKLKDRQTMFNTIKQISDGTQEQKAQHVKGCMGSLVSDWEAYRVRYLKNPDKATVAISELLTVTFKSFDSLTLEAIQDVVKHFGKHLKTLAPIHATISVNTDSFRSALEEYMNNMPFGR